MKTFLTQHAEKIKGTLSGFDRVRFRGTLRWLANTKGLMSWLWRAKVLLKDFKEYSMGLTDQIKQSTKDLAQQQERPIQYLPSSSVRKENVARKIAEQDGITEGLVAVLTAVEPCKTFQVRRNREAKKLELHSHNGKCLHQYFYLIDPELGWLNVRLQTWFPFTVHVVINGREWLSRQMVKEGIDFERRENCFADVANLDLAQQLLHNQSKTDWWQLLDRVLGQVHRSHSRLFGDDLMQHYWSADETEWATDVMFKSSEALSALYPRLVRHAMIGFGCQDILRFLGKRGSVQQFKKAELISHLGSRVEGVRVKHALNGNSVKMYDKQRSVLRVETTINQTRQMKVFRASENNPTGAPSWQRMRKGVADLNRRGEISQKSNERYLEGLSAVDASETLAEMTAAVCQRTKWKGRSVRALNPLAQDDAKLLQAIHSGEFVLEGFRNRDLRQVLFGDADSPEERRRQMAKVTRLIRILRAHGLVHKISKTHRYTVSPQGRNTITALLTARAANTKELLQISA